MISAMPGDAGIVLPKRDPAFGGRLALRDSLPQRGRAPICDQACPVPRHGVSRSQIEQAFPPRTQRLRGEQDGRDKAPSGPRGPDI